MKYEKSCGAIIFIPKEEPEYLLILNKKGNASGHWGFPKGHTEKGESELQTAKREIFEETGLSPEFINGFREVSNYSPFPGINKDVVYFLSKSNKSEVKIQQSELADYKWCSFCEACKLITYDKNLLILADKFLRAIR